MTEILSTLLARPCDQCEFDVASAVSRSVVGLGGSYADAVMRFGPYVFAVEYKSSNYSAAVLRSIQQLRGYLADVNADLIPLVVVPFMGGTGKELCREAGVSWLDLSGNADIQAGELLIKISGEQNRFKLRGRPSSVFAPKSARLARCMLIHPDQAFRQSELSDVLDMSRSLVNKVVKRLLAGNYCDEDDNGLIRLVDPQRLLDDWKAVYDFSHHRIFKGTCPAVSGVKLIQQVSAMLKQSSTGFAVTGLAAAWNLTRHAAFRNATVYVEQLPDESRLQELDFQEGDAGANLWFVLPDDIGVFHGVALVDDVPCVHPIQVYLDLSGMPGRSEEAAAEIYRRFIKLNER